MDETFDAYIYVSDVDRLATELRAKKDGVIGRPSLWIAEDFGCCASG
jgi:hypothetical protein